jgi:hypothetical protein
MLSAFPLGCRIMDGHSSSFGLGMDNNYNVELAKEYVR